MSDKKEELVGLNLAIPRIQRTAFNALAVLENKKMPELFIDMLNLYRENRGKDNKKSS